MPDQTAEERIFNKTFRGLQELSHFNACVGNNGQPGSPEYAAGFLDAAFLLGEKTINHEDGTTIDLFIYPIGFNMRHGVEIWLKHFLNLLKKIRTEKLVKTTQSEETEKVISESVMTQTHDVNVFWEWFRLNSEMRDKRFLELNEKLDEYITDIGQIDPTGQTFRYPFNTESQKHLVKTPIINLVNLTHRIGELKKLLEEYEFRIEAIIDEYNTGTYTKSLSRSQLSYISKQLPPKSKWSSAQFNEIKTRLKRELSVGSQEYSEALNIIQNHREFSENIGLSVPLKSATKDDLKAFLDTWLVFNSEEERNMNAFDAAIDSGLRQKKYQALENAISAIQLNSQADIGAIFYLASYPKYSETYEQLLETELVDVTNSQRDGDSALQYLRHFLTKTNFVTNMVISLKLLGQSQLLGELQQEYEVVDKEVKRICSR